MQMNDVFKALWRRRLLAILVVIATTLLSAAFALTRPPTYEATATIALTPRGDNAGFVTPDTLDALVGTYAQTAKSHIVLDQAAEELGGPPPGSVETATQPGTGILQITGSAESADAAAITANAVSRAFLSYLNGSKIFEPQVVNPAEAPLSPVQPHPPLIIAVGFLLGLIAGAMLAYFVDQLRGRIETTMDIADLTPAPILGALPYERRLARKPSRLVWDDLEMTALQEGLRALRTNIEIVAENHRSVIQVTSALASEGKSLVVANLGVALAKVGIETLIVDADLRRPSQHAIFDVNNDSGLSTLLSGRVDAKPRRVKTEYPGLTLLPSGPILANSTEMLHVRAASLFETLRSTDALVLVDSPPILPITDARILSSRADGVLLVVAAGEEKPSAFRSAIDMLEFGGAPILGVILNRSSDDLLKVGYNRYQSQPREREDASERTPSIR